MGFMTLKKGQPLTDEEIALLSTRKGRSYSGGDSGTGGHGGNSAGGSDGGSSSGNDGSSGSGGTGTANGSTASNNNHKASDSTSIVSNYSPAITSSDVTTGTYSDSDAVDFSNPGTYDRASTITSNTYGGGSGVSSGLSYSPVKTSYWDNDQAVDFNDVGSWADKASSTKDTTYGGESSSIFDSIKNYVLENPLTVTGGLLGLAALGPMGALSLSRLGSTADDIANPETSGLDKAIGVMGLAGMPGMMGLAAKGIVKAADMMGGVNPNPGVNPDRTTAGNETPNVSKAPSYTAPKVEYKFDPFTQSNGLMGSNGKISYSQLHKLVNQFKKQSGGLMSSFSNRSLTGGV